jgi:hypothetical protein
MSLWYQDIPKLIAETDKLYERIVAKGLPGKLQLTRQKILQERGWSPSLAYTEKNLDPVLSELGCFYIPKVMMPGPIFVFPLRDLDGNYPRAQTKPLEGSSEFGEGKGKYRWIGEQTSGPSWFGNSPAMIKRIIERRSVILVEGAFDLIAARLLAPDAPLLCPLTKKIGGKHEAYLRMLGVQKLYLMFDNEKPKDADYDIGMGNLSMRVLSNQIKTMKTEILLCPSSDPSDALKSLLKARALKSLLTSV